MPPRHAVPGAASNGPLLLASACGLALVAALFVPGCERRIEEPGPPARPADPTSVAKVAPSAAATVEAPMAPGASAGSPTKGRCIKPTPPVAERKIVPSPDPRCPRDPETPPKLRSGKVTFTDAKGQTVDVEIAENDHDRQRGLMYRKSMPDAHGMIFTFDRKEDHAFWMHNTCIPLDMLYIDDDGLIVGIEENTPTISDDTFQVGCMSSYVLELNAGFSRAHQVRAGQFVKLTGIK
jgi:uncharacterized protein